MVVENVDYLETSQGVRAYDVQVLVLFFQIACVLGYDGPCLGFALHGEHRTLPILASDHLDYPLSLHQLSYTRLHSRAIIHVFQIAYTFNTLFPKSRSEFMEIEPPQPLVYAHIFELEF